jgi:tetratricopeptide (TPR) repeat protein
LTTALKDRWIDVVTWVVTAVVVGLVAYLGYAYLSTQNRQENSSPAARSVANLSAIVREQPNSAPARVKLAQALAADGRVPEAVTQYQAALKIDPANIDALSGLGVVAMQRREFKTAEGYWLKVIDIQGTGEMATKDQRLEVAYYYLGTTYVEMKRYQDAVGYLKQALRIRKDASDTHYMLSVAYRGLKLDEQAQQELDITLAFDPNNAQANYDMGLLRAKAGEEATAAELFRRSIDNAPSDKLALPTAELKKFGDAATHLAQAKKLAATDPAKAVLEARIAAALDPKSVDALRIAAKAYDQLGKKTEATAVWQRILQLSPQDPEAVQATKGATSGS